MQYVFDQSSISRQAKMFKVVNKNNLQLFVEKSNKAMKRFNFFCIGTGGVFAVLGGEAVAG
ncbi:hypothetical protein ALQ47_02218 [Pseudomonas cichorii]|nr:hypothetical protein ALQ47_02218 [Pseudomonas cichorii]